MKIGFVGAGRVGCSLANYFIAKGIDVSGLYGRSGVPSGLRKFDTINEAVEHCDMIFVTVNDNAISHIWDEMNKKLFNNSDKIICHCSGSLSADVFSDAAPERRCSLHPMLAFQSKSVSEKIIANAFFTIEGGKIAVKAAEDILDICGNKYREIRSESKTRYHAAACFASNFMTAVCSDAFELMRDCGFGDDEITTAMTPLIMGNAQSICKNGIKDSLTGPASRGDVITIKKHLEVLSGDKLSTYKLLSKKMAELSGHMELYDILK